MSAHISETALNILPNNVQLTNGLYAEDDSEDDHIQRHENNDDVIKPSKSKFDRFVEEVKIRETTAMQRIFKECKVDP